MKDLLHNQEPAGPEQPAWHAALNAHLLQRLLRPRVQPGVVSSAPGQAILTRMLQMAGDLPLLSRMLQHLNTGEEWRADLVPIVHAQPVPPANAPAAAASPVAALPASPPVVYARWNERRENQPDAAGVPRPPQAPVVVQHAPSGAAAPPAAVEQRAAEPIAAQPVEPSVRPAIMSGNRVVLPAARHRLAGSAPVRATLVAENAPRASETETSSKATSAEQAQPQPDRVAIAPAAAPIPAPEPLHLTRQHLSAPVAASVSPATPAAPAPPVVPTSGPADTSTLPALVHPAAPAAPVPPVVPTVGPADTSTPPAPGRNAPAPPLVRPLKPPQPVGLTADGHPLVRPVAPGRAAIPNGQPGIVRKNASRPPHHEPRLVVMVGQPDGGPAGRALLLRSHVAAEPTPGPARHASSALVSLGLPTIVSAAIPQNGAASPMPIPPADPPGGTAVNGINSAATVDLEELIEKTLHKLRRQINLESERLGERRWH